MRIENLPGNILDETGTILGQHQGYWHFTPGQRRGLGISAKKPLYVLRVDALRNEVIVGPYEKGLSSGCTANNLHFNIPLLEINHSLSARLRSSQKLVPIKSFTETAGKFLNVEFTEPQLGIAPGQSLVLYQSDMVIGGGIIC